MIVKPQKYVFRFINVYVYNCYHGYTHITSLYTTGVMYEPCVIDISEESIHVLSIPLFLKALSGVIFPTSK